MNSLKSLGFLNGFITTLRIFGETWRIKVGMMDDGPMMIDDDTDDDLHYFGLEFSMWQPNSQLPATRLFLNGRYPKQQILEVPTFYIPGIYCLPKGVIQSLPPMHRNQNHPWIPPKISDFPFFFRRFFRRVEKRQLPGG